jgi:ABC-type transport system substrate-binding protein
MQRMTSAQCPAPPRYAGTNYGCWSNAEYDRSYQIAINTLNEEERTQAIIAAYKAMYDDVGFIWLNYNTNVMAVRRGLEGAIGPSIGSGVSWNVHEWQWVK